MDFENTEIAFKSKSQRDLKRAHFLFNAISKSWLVKTGKAFVNTSLKIHFPMGWMVKPTVYRHFVGGETIEDCRGIVRMLEKFNVNAILDYSVEGKESPEDIQLALDETLRTVKNAAQDKNIPFAVFKPTAFINTEALEKISANKELSAMELQEADNFKKRVGLLCQTAYELGTPILIDAEDCRYQSFFDDVVTAMMEKYNREKAVVFNTLQMYRRDRLGFLEKAYYKAVEGNYFLGIKFVRGAYMERERARATRMGYPSPIHPDKESTDRDYDLALKYSVEHIDRISIFNGTHNEKSSALLADLMKQHNIPANDPRCFFSQLFGMSDHISFNLANEGYNVAKYLPYGPVSHVLPYLIRRVEENTSVAGQTGRELTLITKELNRRKSIMN